MLIRALVILLLVLNVGVASWWALASGPESSAPTGVLPGVEPLQLVTGTVEPAATTPPRDAPVAPVAPVAPKIVQCGSFGGFDKASAAVAAGKLLQADGLDTGDGSVGVLNTAVREVPGSAPRSWRVVLPPLSSAEESDTVAKRIAATGFTDYYVIRDGAEANAIALGLFRSESSARQRAKTLSDRGFGAVVKPVGGGPAKHWLDIAADGPFQAEQVRKQVGARRTEPDDCERLTTGATTPGLGDNHSAR